MPSRIKKSTIQNNLKSTLQSNKTAIVNKKSKRPSVKRKQWTEVSMLSAMKVVKDGKMVSTATESFGVPITTLHDRVTGRITNGKHLGLTLT